MFTKVIKLEIKKKATAPTKIPAVIEAIGKVVKLKAKALVMMEPTEVVIKQESLISLH